VEAAVAAATAATNAERMVTLPENVTAVDQTPMAAEVTTEAVHGGEIMATDDAAEKAAVTAAAAHGGTTHHHTTTQTTWK